MPLEQSVVLCLKLLQLCCGALEALLTLGKLESQLLDLRGQLLPARHTAHTTGT